jgi:hypothetical protein
VRDNNAAHGGSALGPWFAERHVYLRSGSHGHYVVLSRSLQIGVTLGVALVLAGLVAAGYNAIASHLHAGEQQREIGRLERLLSSTQSAAAIRQDLADRARRGDLPAVQAPIEGRSGHLEQSDAAQRRAEAAPAAAGLAELERHLAHAASRPPASLRSSPPLRRPRRRRSQRAACGRRRPDPTMPRPVRSHG